jgi:hypothetical protein
VAQILKESASNHGAWNTATGFGVLDVTAADAAGTRLASATASVR